MKRQLALDRQFNMFMIVGLVLGIMGYSILSSEELVIGICLLVFATIFIVIPAVFIPFIYVFDEKGVSICFLFLPNERYLWENVESIKADWESGSSNTRSPIFGFFFSRVFEIVGVAEGKERFYMQGKIRRSGRTKRLLEKYWSGKITGYLIDNIKEWLRERREKKNTEKRAVDSTKIASIEREQRANVKAWLEPYMEIVSQNNLTLDLRFVYAIKGSKESNSRPKRKHMYEANVKLMKGNEVCDEIRVILIHTRAGKKEYIGRKNKRAKKELVFCLENSLKGIVK